MMNEEAKSDNNFSLTPSSALSLKIRWKIPEYFSIPETVGYSMDSPSFIFANAKWCIRLYPNGKEEESLKTDISLVRLESLVPKNVIICRFDVEVDSTIGLCWDDVYGYSRVFYTENREQDHYEGEIPQRSKLRSDQEEFVPDGTITLVSHLLCEEFKNTFDTKSSVKMDSGRTLYQDFKNLFLAGSNHDLILKVQDKEFRVHRNILSSRSQVFESMLKHDMVEKNSGVVDVPDCDPSAMQQLLLYLYCGEVDDLDKDNMLGLYYAADKYDLNYLKEECHNFIKKSLFPDNICDVVQLAMNHSDSDLLECATKFFIDNIKEILTTTAWLSFMKENLVAGNELLIKASRKWTSRKESVKD